MRKGEDSLLTGTRNGVFTPFEWKHLVTDEVKDDGNLTN